MFQLKVNAKLDGIIYLKPLILGLVNILIKINKTF
jgi:hypothetical protein